jgi:hypothetical protein
MSKNITRIIPHEEWVEIQKNLTDRQKEWDNEFNNWIKKTGPVGLQGHTLP